MKNYFIGYKQANDQYVYVASINKNNVSVTLYTDEAMDCYDVETAKNLCAYVNLKDSMNTYNPIVVLTEITEITEIVEEVIDNGTVTNE